MELLADSEPTVEERLRIRDDLRSRVKILATAVYNKKGIDSKKDYAFICVPKNDRGDGIHEFYAELVVFRNQYQKTEKLYLLHTKGTEEAVLEETVQAMSKMFIDQNTTRVNWIHLIEISNVVVSFALGVRTRDFMLHEWVGEVQESYWPTQCVVES